MDTLSKAHRSWNMSRIRSTNTKPELIVRSLLHRNSYRFGLHRNDLPGKPDIVLPRYHVAILVHGCFWHRHTGCILTTSPKTNVDFWMHKFADNVVRDKRNLKALRALGWKPVIVWQCQTADEAKLKEDLIRQIHSEL